MVERASGTPPIRSVLAAIDEPRHGDSVFHAACDLASAFNAELFLLRVLTLPPEVPPAGHVSPDHMADIAADLARTELRAMAAAKAGIRFGPPLVQQGDPWREILNVSKQMDVDVIVMGRHNYRGLDRVLGTVTSRVVSHADRNVFVVFEKDGRPSAK